MRAVRVASLVKDCPAKRAAVDIGDLIVRVDERNTNGVDALRRLLTAERIGSACRLSAVRRTRPVDIEVHPTEGWGSNSSVLIRCRKALSKLISACQSGPQVN